MLWSLKRNVEVDVIVYVAIRSAHDVSLISLKKNVKFHVHLVEFLHEVY